MNVDRDLFVTDFREIPNLPGFITAYAELNGVLFSILVHKECGAVGVTSIADEDEEIVEHEIVPWLSDISRVVHFMLSQNKRNK